MRYCIKCSKELSRTTKGELCAICYRSRNHSNDENTEHVIPTEHDIPIEINNDPFTQTTTELQDPFNNNYIDDNEERTVIDVIKDAMRNERINRDIIIGNLEDQIKFMKEEILHKNKVINDLLISLSITQDTNKHLITETTTHVKGHNKIKDINDTIIGDIHRPFKAKNVKTTASDFLQTQSICDANYVDPNQFSALEIENEAEVRNDDNRGEYANTSWNTVSYRDKRRQSIFTNKYPERDSTSYKATKHIPGNSTYADLTKCGKNVAILSDSMCRSIYIPKLNSQLVNKVAYKKFFSGATPSDLNYYAVRTLEEKKPDIAIIHVGTNKIGKEDPIEIAKGIMKVVKTCQDKGCNQIFVSGVIYRPDNMNDVHQLNNILQEWQILHDYKIIYNGNIREECLSFDKHHLNKKGSNILSSNFISALNKTADARVI